MQVTSPDQLDDLIAKLRETAPNNPKPSPGLLAALLPRAVQPSKLKLGAQRGENESLFDSLTKIASRTALKVLGVTGALYGPDVVGGLAVADYYKNRMPTEEESYSEAGRKATREMIKKIRDAGVGLVVGPGVGGPAFDPSTNTIVYDTSSKPLHAGVLGHELGHATVHKKMKELFGDTAGANIHSIGSGLLGNVTTDVALPVTTIAALSGKTRAAKRLGLLSLLLNAPRLADEAVSSYYGKKLLDDQGLEGGNKAWAGYGTYVANAALPFVPWAGVSGARHTAVAARKAKAATNKAFEKLFKAVLTKGRVK
jgi:hypothetical protein